MNILLPIETINREIDYKIILANLLSSQGHKIYIGQHNFLMSLLDVLEGGLYIGKNMFSRHAENEKGLMLKKLKDKKFTVIYLHEEGGVFPGDEDNWKNILKNQYDVNLFSEDDTVCVWGDFQQSYDIDRLKKNITVVTTGHPRFDIYKEKWREFYADDVKPLKERYGRYVLINGNYGIANHGLGLEHVFRSPTVNGSEDEQFRLKKINFFASSTKQLMEMVQLTYVLAVKFPDLNFVYRPHPSESRKYYETIFRGKTNIIVNHEGSVGPWLMGAMALLHDGCTTAIEASFLNIPVINFKPHPDEDHDIWLPNQMGARVSTIEEAAELLANIGKASLHFQNFQSTTKISSLLYNFNGDSFGRLMGVVNKKIVEMKHVRQKSLSSTFISKKYFISKLKLLLFSGLSRRNSIRVQYHHTKFYGFNTRTIEDKFDAASRITKIKSKVLVHNPLLIQVE